MTNIPLYRSRSHYRIWIALLISALLHCAAIAFASLPRTRPAIDPPYNSDDGVLVFVEPESASTTVLPPEMPEPSPPPLPVDEPLFQQKEAAPLQRERRTASEPIHRLTQPRISSGHNSSSAKVFALHAPRPEYPYEARRDRITGEGVASLTIDPSSGRVIDVMMTTSTGSAVLDQAALAGFRHWRFRPGTPAIVRCPISYTLTGVRF